MESPPGIGLYIHIPFCQAKCGYCDFNSYAGLEGLFEPYAAALVRDIERSFLLHNREAWPSGPAQVRTIYVGGGTPSVLPVPLLARVLEAAHSALAADTDTEVSLEANPGTVDGGRLAALREAGINRLSLGVQSLEDADLRLLGRIHTAAQAVEAFQAARAAGFENVSLDLIYGLPGQSTLPGNRDASRSLAAWQATLERAVALEPEHLSLYALTVEEGTPLAARIAAGDLPEPDPDLAADMYEQAEVTLAAAGYVHYEISNWARGPAWMCRHNLTYWRNEPYLGVGAGAHSWAGGRRWANIARPAGYIERLLAGDGPVGMEETIGPALERGETMMLGLRLLEEGVAFDRFAWRFGCDLRQQFAAELAELAGLGLIAIDQERVTLSARGHLLANQVFCRFLPDPE